LGGKLRVKWGGNTGRLSYQYACVAVGNRVLSDCKAVQSVGESSNVLIK
jgi:hypothetical protein